MAPKATRVLDAVAVAGYALVLASLALPWLRERSCPIFGECGPWTDSSGWHELGWPIAAVVGGVAAFLLLPKPGLRRGAALAGSIVLGAVLLDYAQWADFTIFGDARLLGGLFVAAAGDALALVGSVGALGFGLAPRPAATFENAPGTD